MALNVAIENLSFWFGQQQVLKNVSLLARRKEVTAIIGPSGCGKLPCCVVSSAYTACMPILASAGRSP